MNKTPVTPNSILKALALLSVIGLCVALTLAAVDVKTRLATTFGKLDNEIDEVHRLTLEAGLTAMEARKASVKESAMLDQWNAQIALTMTDVQNVMNETAKTVASIQAVTGAATDTLQTAQTTVQALQAPIAQADTDLAALEPLIAHSDALVTNPAITATLANVQSTTGHLDATAENVQQTVYKYTHPGVWSKIKSFALDIAHVFNPL